MMLGNVAPAPFSLTWAAAGAASVRAVASARSGAFIMRDASSWLERELRLEQGLGANRVLRHQRRPLEVDVVPVAEQPPVGGELIRHAARSEAHTSELQSPDHLVCRLLLEKNN